MKYKLELNFTDKTKCSSCMLSGTRGLNLEGETVMACFALGTRPKCPEEGCREDCPLKKAEVEKLCSNCLHDFLDVEDEPCNSCKHTCTDYWKPIKKFGN